MIWESTTEAVPPPGDRATRIAILATLVIVMAIDVFVLLFPKFAAALWG